MRILSDSGSLKVYVEVEIMGKPQIVGINYSEALNLYNSLDLLFNRDRVVVGAPVKDIRHDR